MILPLHPVWVVITLTLATFEQLSLELFLPVRVSFACAAYGYVRRSVAIAVTLRYMLRLRLILAVGLVILTILPPLSVDMVGTIPTVMRR